MFKHNRYLYEKKNLGNFDMVYPITDEDRKFLEHPNKYEEFLAYSQGLFNHITKGIDSYYHR